MARAKISLGKVRGRVDFDPAEFDKTIMSHGARCLWSRALRCPRLLNTETRHADPSCPVCDGDGWFYVKPSNFPRLKEYDCATPKHEDTDNAVATQILVQSITKDPQVFEKIGEWIFGTVRLTPFSFGRVNFHDRIVLTEAVTAYQQVIEVPASRRWTRSAREIETHLRYPVVRILDAYTVPDGDDSVARDISESLTIEDGEIVIRKDIEVGTLVTFAYEYNPVFIVQDHMYAWRDTLKSFKTKSSIGVNVYLPHHAMARLDFLIGKSGGG